MAGCFAFLTFRLSPNFCLWVFINAATHWDISHPNHHSLLLSSLSVFVFVCVCNCLSDFEMTFDLSQDVLCTGSLHMWLHHVAPIWLFCYYSRPNMDDVIHLITCVG